MGRYHLPSGGQPLATPWVPGVLMSILPLTYSEYSSRSSTRLEQSNLQLSMSYISQLVGASSSFSGNIGRRLDSSPCQCLACL